MSKGINQTLFSPQINTCYTVLCASTGENECLWTDWLLDNSLNGEQARQYACIRRSDTTCSWYRGGPPPEKDFLDMTDPWPCNLTPATPFVLRLPWLKFGNFTVKKKLADFYIQGSLTHRWASVSRVQVDSTAMLGKVFLCAGAFSSPLSHFFALTHSTSLDILLYISADHPLKPRVNLLCIISVDNA